MSKAIFGLVAGALALLATASVAGASIWGTYQPPVPKSLEH